MHPENSRFVSILKAEDLLDLLAMLDALVLLSLLYSGQGGLARILFAAFFTFFVPGRAIVDNWRTIARWSEVAMSLVLSLVSVGLVATVSLWAHFWHPLVLFQVEAWLSVSGLIVGAARRHEVLAPQFVRLQAVRGAPQDHEDRLAPMWVGLVDLDTAKSISGPNGPLRADHERARMLVRMHGAPLGYVDVQAHPKNSLGKRAIAEAKTMLDVVVQGHVACDAVADDPTTSQLWFARAACPLRFPHREFDGLTIAVCTRDRVEFLRQCMNSLKKIDRRHRIEILIVDNAPSDDATRKLVSTQAKLDSRVRYTCEPDAGLSRARNHALAVARFEHVAFTDDDVLVDREWPTAITAGFALDPDVVCVTGFVASATLETASQRYFDSRIPWGEAFVPRRYDMREHRDPFPLYPFNAGLFGAGANFAVRASAVEEIGGFDARLGAGSVGRGGEDLDVFVRLVLGGGRICYIPSALVWHTQRADPASLRRQMYDYGHGLGAYLAKHTASRELRSALFRHGLSHGKAILKRQGDASRRSNLGRKGLRMALTEARGLVAGALHFWWGSLRDSASTTVKNEH